jgi:hypothetical protein
VKDRLGILFSGLCVVHCVLFSLFLWGGVGSIGFIAVSEELIHPMLLLLVFIIGLLSFPSAYNKHKQERAYVAWYFWNYWVICWLVHPNTF